MGMISWIIDKQRAITLDYLAIPGVQAGHAAGWRKTGLTLRIW